MITKLMLTLVLALCAWTTASAAVVYAYQLTEGTLSNCDISFKVGTDARTSANAGETVIIVVTPQDGYSSSVENIKATASMGTGGMQARRRAELVKDIEVTATATANEYTITMPAAHVTVDVTCLGDEQTVTSSGALPVTTSGTFTFTPTSPKTGEMVTVTPTPAAGWHVEEVKLDAESPNTDVNAPQDGTTGNYKYVQPGYGGAITVTFAKTAYTVTAGTVTAGSVSTIAAASRAENDPATPAATDFYVGDVVTFTAAPTNSTDVLKSLTVSFEGLDETVTPEKTTTANQYQFSMLAGNATVSAEFTNYIALDVTTPAPKPLIYDENLTPSAGYRDMTDNDKPESGDQLKAQPGNAVPIEIKWYHTDNNGNPTGDPIGTGENYTITDNDLGKDIVYVIEQPKDENGNDQDPIPTKISTAFTTSPAAGTISFAASTVTKTFGEAAFTNTLTNSGDGTVTYSVTAETLAAGRTSGHVATVNASNGQVTIVGAGTATIKATVANSTHYTYETKTVSYTLTVNKATITATVTGFDGRYDGSAHGINVNVTKPGSGYEVKYGTAQGTYDLAASPTYTDIGTNQTVYYQITAENYTTKTGSAAVKISKMKGEVNFSQTTVEKNYGDANFTVTPTVTGDGTLTYSSDNHDVATVNSSTGVVTITGVGSANITATMGATATYTNASDSYRLSVGTTTLTDDMIDPIYDQGYTGEPLEPSLTVRYGNKTLVAGTDYTAVYTNNVNFGTATVTITGTGKYTGTASATFTIGPAWGYVNFYSSYEYATYGDEPFTVTPYVYGDGELSYSSSDTSVATVDNDGRVTVKSVGNTTITCTMASTTYYYGDSDYYYLTVSAKSVTDGMIGDIAEQSYTGGPLTPAVVVTDGTATLAAGTDYTVEYSANIDPGTATATITGQGNYTGTASKTFTIVNNNPTDTEDEASITISATGKSTFVSSRDVDFTNSTAQAYVAVGYDAVAKELTLSRVYKVPAGTPVMVKGRQGVLEVPFTSGVTTQYLDMFVGNTSSQTVEVGETEGELTNYVMKSGEFTPVATNAYVPTGKAYLQLPTSFLTTKKGADQQVTLPASGKRTYCSTVDLDFTDVSGLKAYAAIGFDTQTNIVTLSRVLKASAGTPLVLHGTSNTTYTIPSIEAQTTYANMFVGNNSGAAIVVGETDENDPSLTNYYLTSGEFKAVVDNLTVPDGRCYLQLPAAASARALTRSMDADGFRMVENDDILVIRLDGSETTKVEDLLKAAAGQDVYYNMGGVRTEKPGKGVYVKGQRKIAIK